MNTLNRMSAGIAIAMLLGLSAPAYADGMAGGKIPMAAPPYNWGGLYAGGHIGFGSSDISGAFADPVIQAAIPLPEQPAR
jgi:hypothetical protein